MSLLARSLKASVRTSSIHLATDPSVLPVTAPASPKVKSFLRTFFHSDYNGITKEDVRNSSELQRLIEPLLGEEQQPTVLPWRKPDGEEGSVDYWFALARTANELYEQRADLQAFVGTTYARIEGGRRRRSKDTPFARSLEEMTNGHVLLFTGEDGAILQGALQWLKVRAARPDRDIPDTRSTGLLLRDYDAALQTKDREQARAVLSFLRSDHRLDSRNLQFLEVKLYAAFQDWGELLRHAQTTRLVRLQRRPAAVTDALLRALYHVHLREVVRRGDLKVLEETLMEFASTMSSLWTQRTGLQSRVAWLTYGLATGLVEEDRDGVKAAYTAVTQRGGDGNLLMRLLERIKRPDLPDDPRVVFAHRDYDRALELVRAMPEGPERVGLLVLLSRELGTLEVQQEAWEAVTQLSDGEMKELTTVERDALARLEEALTPAEAQVTGWSDLLQALRDDTLTHAQVLRLVQAGHREWTLASLVRDPDELVDVLLSIPERKQATLQDILTYIVDVLQQDTSYPDPALREVYDLLLLLLLETPHPRPDAFYNAVDLLPGILGALDEDEYTERIRDVLDLLERTTARLHPDRLLDFVDLLIASDCPNVAMRQACLTYVDQHRRQNAKHWSRSHWRFLKSLGEEVGLSELVPSVPPPDEAEEVSDPLLLFEDQYVGIYTLTVSAGKRVAELLSKRVPDIEVQLSHAKVSTQKLTAMAQNADVFLMVTSSATHAATETIMDHLGEDTKLVRPSGKGSSSMLSALEKAALELAE